MLTNRAIMKVTTWRTLQPAQAFLKGIAGAVLCCGIVFLIESTGFAQQRVVVEKATGNVVDVGDQALQYDSRYFDHMDFPGSPIPAGQDVSKYRRDASGAIVLRPKDELSRGFTDEWRSDMIARINAAGVSSDLKALLIEIVKNVRR